jgi:acyl-CoA reductase-like NAD-dependent aldehyde dehydrogenase
MCETLPPLESIRPSKRLIAHFRPGARCLPRRGELVRLLGAELRAAKDQLGRLVTIEAGKIATEGCGEVQEMIDICDFAVGLSRQLYGLTIASERPAHRMMEQGIRSARLASLPRSIFPLPCGPGMQH